MNTDPERAAKTESSTASADPAPPLRPVPAAEAAIRKLSDPSSSKPAPAKSDGSIASSVESILSPDEDFRSRLNVVEVKSRPSPAVYSVLVSVEATVICPFDADVTVTLVPPTM